MWTRALLESRLSQGDRFRYVHFWGHTPKAPGAIDASCLSQWFPRSFSRDGVRYATAEHYMMAEKARLFGDEEALSRVLASTNPEEAKALGRSVRGFRRDEWEAARVDVVVRGNEAKFTEHRDLGDFLRGTDQAVLVEASPVDTIWGIGLAARDAGASDPTRWRGQNLLGFALMEVRDRLRKRSS